MHREEQPGGTHVPESYFLQTGLCYPLNQQHERDHFHQQTPERKDAENNLIMFVTINLSLFILLSWPGRLLGLRGTQEERWLCPLSAPLHPSTPVLPHPSPCFIHGSSTSLKLPASLILTFWATLHGT